MSKRDRQINGQINGHALKQKLLSFVVFVVAAAAVVTAFVFRCVLF